MQTAVGGDVDAWFAQMSSDNCGRNGGGTEEPEPDNPEDDGEGGDDGEDGQEDEDEDDDDDVIISGYEDFDWDNLDMTDTSTWPTPPSGGTYGYPAYTEGVPSRDKPARFGQKSYYDEDGGEWRPEKSAEYEDGTKKPGYYNYKPYTKSGNHRWINVDSSGEEIEGI